MLIIGVTGTIACGKSTVDAMLLQLGATTAIDADSVVHTLLREDSEVRSSIRRRFGPAVFALDGTIDRRALGSIVFSDARALHDLEAITHPAVRRQIRAQLAAMPGDAIVVIDAVKLLEGELGTLAHCVWWVTARPEQQLDRLMRNRGLTLEQATARLASQPSFEQWRDRVNVVIDNSGSISDTLIQVHTAFNLLVATYRPDGTGREMGVPDHE